MWAKAATRNADSSIVLLGKGDKINTTKDYANIAYNKGYTYFKLHDDTWDDLFSQLKRGGMWKINEHFLDIQISKNKTFYFSHNPYDYLNDGSFFADEIEYLRKNGYKISNGVNSSGFYYAIKQ